ncbi:MAG TPA: 1-deoxy-D-xylulose-5-phosphate reductoisomerase [Acidimicrobiia bacterium]|nr:1-deoxy-D-xylulose-5-phosphate reductoisomerase [Acidimicrobiia bacterium]
MIRPVVVLGATGSIGRQALEVAQGLGAEIAGISAGRLTPTLLEVARRHPGAAIAVAGGSHEERRQLLGDLPGRVLDFGPEAVAALAAAPGRIVVNGVVGLAGLGPTLAALAAGNRLALANKESLVGAGALVIKAKEEGGGELIPVDSEHSAIFQSLMGEDPDVLSRIWLTASGGPFLHWSEEEMAAATPDQALRHPNWEMGRRITIDSATLANKGLEVIEAHQLFGLDYDQISVVIHPQSIIHSMVELRDGSVKAQMGPPDMRLPIEFALTYPRRGPNFLAPFRWAGQTLEFLEPDLDRFPALDLAYQAGRAGGSAPAVFNAADEVVVEAFLQGRVSFAGIARIIAGTLDTVPWREPVTVEEVIEIDGEARQTAASLVAGAC